MPNSPINAPGSITSSTGGTTDNLDTDNLRADADALVEEAKTAARKVADEAGGQAAELASQAKDQLAEATDKVKSMADDQKELLAQQFGGVADAIQKVASELEGTQAPAATYARMIADNASMLSDKLQNADVDELLGIAQDFGRKQPAAFMGAAALLGFAASRFLLASAKRQETRVTPQQDNFAAEDSMPRSNGMSTPGSYEAGRI